MYHDKLSRYAATLDAEFHFARMPDTPRKEASDNLREVSFEQALKETLWRHGPALERLASL